LDLGAGLDSTVTYTAYYEFGGHSQLVIRSNEWDGESGTEVEEGLDGQRSLLVVVEWDVLQYTFVNLPAWKTKLAFEEDRPCIRRACHGIGRARLNAQNERPDVGHERAETWFGRMKWWFFGGKRVKPSYASARSIPTVPARLVTPAQLSLSSIAPASPHPIRHFYHSHTQNLVCGC